MVLSTRPTLIILVYVCRLFSEEATNARAYFCWRASSREIHGGHCHERVIRLDGTSSVRRHIPLPTGATRCD